MITLFCSQFSTVYI